MRDFAQALSRVRCWDERTERVYRQRGVPADDTILQTRGELELLCQFIERERIRSFLEIGSWTGRLILTLQELFSFERIAACDLGLAAQLGLPFHLKDQSFPCFFGSSHSAEYRRWREQLGPFDLTLIDGDHSYEGVVRDFEINSALPGRFLVFHDIVGAHPSTEGVRQFWQELEGEKVELLAPHLEAGFDSPTMGIGIWRIGSGQHHRRSAPREELPFVSVVVPVRDDAKRLPYCLTALEDQHYPKHRYEVVVVDDGSEASVAPLMGAFRQARLIVQPGRGPAAARNAGVREARGELIAFTDSDCIPEPSWLLRAVTALHRSKADLVGGRVRLHVERPAAPSAVELYEIAVFAAQPRFIEQLHFAATANVLVRRSVVERVAFDEACFPHASGEDMDWGARLHEGGFTQCYADEVEVLHPARRSLLALLRKERARIRGLAAVLKKRGVEVSFSWDSAVVGAKLLPETTPLVVRVKFAAICWCVAVIAWFERRR